MIIRYLKDSLNFKLYLGSSNITLYGYCNAEQARDANNRGLKKSFVFFVSVGGISQNCKKQPTIARLLIKAKYMAASYGTMEKIWLWLLL